MPEKETSSPSKAAASRQNGKKGGTKSPERSCYNALSHGLTSKKFYILKEGKDLPEYSEYVALYLYLVCILSPQCPDEFIDIEIYVQDLWLMRRALRFEFSETEKKGNGMESPGMVNLQRYVNSVRRRFAQSSARIQQLRERQQPVANPDIQEDEELQPTSPAPDASSMPASGENCRPANEAEPQAAPSQAASKPSIAADSAQGTETQSAEEPVSPASTSVSPPDMGADVAPSEPSGEAAKGGIGGSQ